MIGIGSSAELLVDVVDNYNPVNFNFYVVNGNWEGFFIAGEVYYSDRIGCIGTNYQILTSNQDRLRGDYNTVFNNFDNINYIAPHYKKYTLYEDNIPF